MKFTVMYKYSDEVKRYYYSKRGKAYGDGVKLIGLGKRTIIDNDTGEVIYAYAFHCKSSIINYLKHKREYGKYAAHLIGWK